MSPFGPKKIKKTTNKYKFGLSDPNRGPDRTIKVRAGLRSPVGPNHKQIDVDRFLERYNAISRSTHHLARRLSTLMPPISAAFSDLFLVKGFNSTTDPPQPLYKLHPRFLSLVAYLPKLVESPPLPTGHPIDISGLDPFSSDNIPPPFFHTDHDFTSLLVSNAQHLHLSKGILANTFDSFEPETLSAINSGRALSGLLPPVFGVGPLHRSLKEGSKSDALMTWLDEQPNKSVIYVSFGNRTAMSKDQIRELGIGLKRSGYGMIDKEEKAELGDLLGKELEENLEGGDAVGEPKRDTTPQGGRRVCESLRVELGDGGGSTRGAGGKVVGAEEIAEKVELVMGNGVLRSATWVGEEEAKACGDGGSSTATLVSIIGELKSR
ncbi:hypothetical protein V2J09_014970 [Rumex salicifolius]